MVHKHSNDRMDRLEISVKNNQDGIQKLFLHSARHEQQIELLDQKVDSYQQENRERFKMMDLRFEAMNQRFEAMDQRFEAMDQRFDQQDKTIAILTEAIVAGFKRSNEQYEQLTLLVRQLLPNNPN